MPPKPAGSEEGIIKGMYKLRSAPKGDGPVVRLIGSGPIMLQLLAAVEILETYGVRSEIYSATSYGELRREGLECERNNRLNPSDSRQIPYVEELLGDGTNPTIAVSDNQIWHIFIGPSGTISAIIFYLILIRSKRKLKIFSKS